MKKIVQYRKRKTRNPTHLAALFTVYEPPSAEKEKAKQKKKVNDPPSSQRVSPRTKYIQPTLPLDKPLRSRLRPTRVRQVNREPDELARAVPHPFLLHPPDRMLRLFLAPRGDVHLCAASHEVEGNVQTDARALIPPTKGAAVSPISTKSDSPGV